MIVSALAVLTIVIVVELVSAGELLSVTEAVKLKVPAVVGVPESTPDADKARPVGSCPEPMVQL